MTRCTFGPSARSAHGEPVGVTLPATVLFVCRHGAAKSVLAAADLRRIAAERGLDIGAVAAGLDPEPHVASVLIEALPADGLEDHTPRAVTAEDLAAASQVITFNLTPSELPFPSPPVECWDDVPSVSEDFEAARAAIRLHLDRLIEQHSTPDPS
jgi:arsenate reductase (thioredoxin)